MHFVCATSLFISPCKRAFPFGKALDAEGLEGSASAEHEIGCSQRVVPVEQRVCAGIVVEVVEEATHHAMVVLE